MVDRLQQGRYIDINTLTEAERDRLKSLNSEKKGTLLIYEGGQFYERSNADILSENEIKIFLNHHRQSPALPIIARIVPTLYYEAESEKKIGTELINSRTIHLVKNQLIAYLKEFPISEHNLYRMWYSVVPVGPEQLPSSWYEKFGDNWWLAYNLLSQVPSPITPYSSSDINQEKCVRFAISYLESNDFSYLKEKEIVDPLVPIRKNIVKPEITDKKRDARYLSFIIDLKSYLSGEIDTNAFVEKSNDLPNAFKEDVILLTQLLPEAQDYSNQEASNAVHNCIARLCRQTASQGYYFRLQQYHERDGERYISKWELMYGTVTRCDRYATDPTIYDGQAYMDIWTLRDPNPPGMDFNYRQGYTTGLTFGVTPYTSIYIYEKQIESGAESNKQDCMDEQPDWMSALCQDFVTNKSDADNLRIKQENTSYHESEHYWQQYQDVHQGNEESAEYATVLFSDDPLTQLAHLFFQRTDDWEGNINFNKLSYGEGVKNLFYGLASLYGISPNQESSEPMAWVQTLFTKIQTATPDQEANNSLLRQQVARLYQQRFGPLPEPFLYNHPVEIVHFND